MSNDDINVKKDMLKLTSSVQQILRAMYFYRSDYLLAQSLTRERLFHKEQLVALMEQGGEMTTLDDLFTTSLKEPVSAKMRVEDVARPALLLLFTQSGGGEGELTLTTFGAYRERKINENTIIMPDWWGIPLPLVYIDEDRVLLNAYGTEMIPGGAVAMARQVDRMKSDRIVVLRDGKRDRTFSLSPLGANTYFIEDISGDFEMAEDLVWWAAAGRAFVARMQNNGIDVVRLSPFEELPEDAAEVIDCRWEGEVVGRMVIKLPAASDQREATAAQKPSSEPAAKPAKAPQSAAKPSEQQTGQSSTKKPAAPKPASAPQAKSQAQKSDGATTGQKPAAAKQSPASSEGKKPSPAKQKPKAPPAPAKAAEEPKEPPAPKEQPTPQEPAATSEPPAPMEPQEPPAPQDQPEEVELEPEEIIFTDEVDDQENLRRNAAKNAYGIKTQSAADDRPKEAPSESTDVDKVMKIREANAPQPEEQ